MCPKITHLTVTSRQLTVGTSACLRGLSLTNIDIRGCIKLTDAALVHLKGMHLTSVDFSRCDGFTNAALAQLGACA